MSVYCYRITTRTVRTNSGETANLTECLGSGPYPYFQANNRALAAWERKLATGRKRGDEVTFTGLFAESDVHGEPIYVGALSVYTDAINYVQARDVQGKPMTVHNLRKRG